MSLFPSKSACASLVAAIAITLSASAPAPALASDLGDPAPELAVSEWVKGGPVAVAGGKGGIYVVEFWATWCPPCRASIPHLTELQHKYKDKGVVFVGVTSENDGAEKEKVKKFVAGMGEKMDYAVAIDAGNTSSGYMEAFGVDGIPHAFIVDKQGRIAWHGHPMDKLDEVLDQVVAGTFDVEAARATEAAKERLEAGIVAYFELAAAGGDDLKAAELAKQILTDGKDAPESLLMFAWVILEGKHPETGADLKRRDVERAVEAAKLAYDKSEGKELGAVVVYARGLVESGKKSEGIELHRKAIAMAPEEAKAELEEMLKGYEGRAE